MWSDRKRNQSSIIALVKLFKIDAVDLRTLLLHFVIKLYPQGRYYKRCRIARSRTSFPQGVGYYLPPQIRKYGRVGIETCINHGNNTALTVLTRARRDFTFGAPSLSTTARR